MSELSRRDTFALEWVKISAMRDEGKLGEGDVLVKSAVAFADSMIKALL